MTVEEILGEWDKDSKIDQTELGRESLRVSELHHKYYKMFVGERLARRKLEAELKDLKLRKHEFYLHGPSRETEGEGWRHPGTRPLRSDLGLYTDADEGVQLLTMRIGYQQEKIDLLESIIKLIGARNYAIKNAIDFLRFTNGG